MSYRSCYDCFSEAEDKKFCDSLIKAFVRGGTYAVIFFTTSYLIDKTIKHSGKIKELSSSFFKSSCRWWDIHALRQHHNRGFQAFLAYHFNVARKRNLQSRHKSHVCRM